MLGGEPDAISFADCKNDPKENVAGPEPEICYYYYRGYVFMYIRTFKIIIIIFETNTNQVLQIKEAVQTTHEKRLV